MRARGMMMTAPLCSAALRWAASRSKQAKRSRSGVTAEQATRFWYSVETRLSCATGAVIALNATNEAKISKNNGDFLNYNLPKRGEGGFNF
jgi:hypothetical protein